MDSSRSLAFLLITSSHTVVGLWKEPPHKWVALTHAVLHRVYRLWRLWWLMQVSCRCLCSIIQQLYIHDGDAKFPLRDTSSHSSYLESKINSPTAATLQSFKFTVLSTFERVGPTLKLSERKDSRLHINNRIRYKHITTIHQQHGECHIYEMDSLRQRC